MQPLDDPPGHAAAAAAYVSSSRTAAPPAEHWARIALKRRLISGLRHCRRRSFMPKPLSSCRHCGAGAAEFLRDESTGQTVGTSAALRCPQHIMLIESKSNGMQSRIFAP